MFIQKISEINREGPNQTPHYAVSDLGMQKKRKGACLKIFDNNLEIILINSS